MPFAFWPTAPLIGLALVFLYFLVAGARTFVILPGDERPSWVAQMSFAGTGAFATMALGYRAQLPSANALAAFALVAASLTLYEWARRTIRDRRFRIAWSGEVPGALCEEGPYRRIRHPVYAAYILVFAGLLAALPSWWTLAIFAGNAALFAHAARHDERAMAANPLASAYATYRARTGMFVPRWR